MNDFQPSQRLIDFIKQPNNEGQYLVPYVDAAGFLTWGSGHKAKPGEQVPSRLTPEQSDAILTGDLSVAGGAVRRLVTVEMTQEQFDALTDFAFNLGEGAFESSTMLSDVNRSEWVEAADQCKRWDHAHVKGQLVVLAGLTARRAWEAALLVPPEVDEMARINSTVVYVAPILPGTADSALTPQQIEQAAAAPVVAGGGGDFAGAGATGDYSEAKFEQVKAEVAADEAAVVHVDPTVAPYTPPAESPAPQPQPEPAVQADPPAPDVPSVP